jgi:hypothetical protein
MTPNFSVSQSSGALQTATFLDTSTAEVGVTGRLLYMRKYNGSYLVPNGYTTSYVFWPVSSGSGDTIDVANLLDKDYALDITMVMYGGSSIVATKTILTLFTGYGDLFLRQLTKALAANKTTITNKNFWLNKNKLRVLLDDAAQAVALLNDQTIAQFCLDAEVPLINNLSSFF